MAIAEPGSGSGATPRFALTRRRALAGAGAAGAGIAALRLLALAGGPLAGAERLLGRGQAATAGRPDWASPLAAEPARVAHLLRRATFGATLDDLERAASDGLSKTVDRLLETPAAPPPDPGAAVASGGARIDLPRLQLWWVDHMLSTPTPFAERMTLFWHGHFTSDFRKVGLQVPFIYWQNLTWRQMALTDLRSMLVRVTTDPAMLRYLDLGTSTGQSPNENYARELMELFTLGAGNFAEGDVRAAARALAGWVEPRPSRLVDVVVDPKSGATRKFGIFDAPATGRFVPARAYRGGPLTFLGRAGVSDAAGVVDRILAQPATAAFIARRVALQFVGASVDDSYVRRLGDRFRSSGHDVKTLMREVFTSPEFAAGSSYRALVKSPTELMLHALKALGAPQLSRLVVSAAGTMGQVLFDPPDVGGWPSNDAWISSNTVLARVNFVTRALAQLRSLPPAGDAPRHVDGVLGPGTAAALERASGDRARWLLLLASPEFQLK